MFNFQLQFLPKICITNMAKKIVWQKVPKTLILVKDHHKFTVARTVMELEENKKSFRDPPLKTS